MSAKKPEGKPAKKRAKKPAASKPPMTKRSGALSTSQVRADGPPDAPSAAESLAAAKAVLTGVPAKNPARRPAARAPATIPPPPPPPSSEPAPLPPIEVPADGEIDSDRMDTIPVPRHKTLEVDPDPSSTHISDEIRALEERLFGIL